MRSLVFVVFAAAFAQHAAAKVCAPHLGECKTSKPLPKSKWWQEELFKSQEKCAEVDPNGSGTCHQWTNELSPKAQAAVNDIKTTVGNYIKASMGTEARDRELTWNDQMDELYLSAPKHGEGSDKVFITPHIDGFFGWMPFMTAFRCVYGLTGPHETVTLQPMRGMDEYEINLSPGRFTCFDYNREVHWIEHREEEDASNHSERMVLKLHFYEYPKLLTRFAKAFGDLNAQYNFFARRMFLVSQFPDRSWISKQVGRVINAITLYGGNAESWFGYMNMGIVLLLLTAVAFRPHAALATAGSAYLVIYLLGFIFRSAPFGMFMRDCIAFKSFGMALLGYVYLTESIKFGWNVLSLATAAAGFGMAAVSYWELGPTLSFYGMEFGVVDAGDVDTTLHHTVANPMIIGSIFGLCGLRLHPQFGRKFHKTFVLQVALYVTLLAAEKYDIFVPASHSFVPTLAEFVQYHQVSGDVYAHLLTTGVALLGVFGLVYNQVAPRTAARAKAVPETPVAVPMPVSKPEPKTVDAPKPVPKSAPPTTYDVAVEYVFGKKSAATKEAADTSKPVPKPASKPAPEPKPVATPDCAPVVPNVALLLTAYAWILVRYTVTDDDAAFLTVGVVALLAAVVAATRPSGAVCAALIAIGTGAQEYAHMHFKEETYMSSYAAFSSEAALTFALHNLWLLPFELRAAITHLTSTMYPTKSM